jgi:hypothetical protein
MATVAETLEPTRGIHVGKSWPRAATPCDLVPRWEGEFASHADWVNFASKRLTVATSSRGPHLPAICVDALGRRCANGKDMMRARDEDAFPVRYFWDCWPNAGECGDEGLLCDACSLPAHELTQVPGCGAPMLRAAAAKAREVRS